MSKQIDELTLLLLYLTSFSDDYGFGEEKRSWKGYPFQSLNKLNDKLYIVDNKRAKSISFTDEGIKKAQKLMKKYHIDDV